MTRAFAFLAISSVAFLISTAVHAERIKVTSGRGDHLLDQCARSPDFRLVSTNQGTYSGCCSEALGYCILCPVVGECYKFISMKSLNEFRKDLAPAGGTAADEKPVLPSRRLLKKVAPQDSKVIE